MSLSVDDLVASFNSNHIGQEAIDLANLQAQLTQALRQSAPQSVPRKSHGQSNTPIARTPSTSFSWEPDFTARARSSSVASASQLSPVGEHMQDTDDMDEDERMVEEMLFTSPTNSHFSQCHNLPSGPGASHSSAGYLSRRPSIPHISGSYEHVSADLPPSNTSLFATTDPFFLAACSATQTPSPSNFFAQAGRPSAHSPFLLSQQFQSSFGHGHSHTHRPMSPEVEPHINMFAAPPATFTC